MNKKQIALIPPFFILTSYSLLFAADIAPHSNSLQGYTGALNVPSAYTAQLGNAALQYSDAYFVGDTYEHNHNAVGNFGLLPFFEAGGRISWDTTHTNCYMENCGVRDLSANLKLAAPFIPDDWFALAVGAQDIGGQANYFSAEYAVASKQFRYGRIDVGAGRTDLPNRYLDGSFGAVELQPWSWLGLIAEFDAKDMNAGFRIGLPKQWQRWGVEPELKVMAFSDRAINQDQRFFGLSVNIPLGASQEHHADKHAQPTGAPPTVISADLANWIAVGQSSPAKTNNAPIASPTNTQNQFFYDALADQLKNDKFEHILIGEQAGTLFVAFENNQFNRNEVDALALVLKRVSQHAISKFKYAHVIVRNQKIAVLDVVIKPDNYQAFLNDQAGSTTLYLDARYPENGLLGSVDWFVEKSYGVDVKPRIAFSPGLITAVATEYGVLDYSVSLQTDAAVSLWGGALLAATYNMPIDQTEDFDRYAPDYGLRGVFYNDRQRSKFDEYEVQQTLKIASGLFTTFHAGHFMRDYDGFYNQTAWFSPEGQHKLTLRSGQFEHEDNPLLERDVNLLSYRYFFSSQDVSLETTYGEFWEGDEGYRVDTRFWFGDTSVTLEYKDTDAQFVGMRWTIPLTPRRDILTPYGQIKGRENWNYGLQTRINEDANFVSFGAATIPRTRNEIERVYANNDRLSPTYVKNHWRRLKEAAKQYP